ncbi:MAG: proprotein convertase P-domain-containing protein [Xanthomonadales bacterium]|nr:proprotein convertase P-domain-containing protein [Xanthomonadales bacterium]
MNVSRMMKTAALALLLPFAAGANPPQVGEPVTPQSFSGDIRNLPTAAPWAPGMSIREAHKRQFRAPDARAPHTPANKPTKPDGLPELQQMWDESNARSLGATNAGGRISINNGSTGVSPGDPVVEVGPNHILYGVNGSSGTTFTVYNKTGSLVAGPTTFKSLATGGSACATSVSDPIIMFDRMANRWFMLEMGGSSSSPYLCTYVSKTSDPVSGGWWYYGFSAPSTPDYPHCGIWNNAYVCGDNEGNAQVSVYAFDRERMLLGQTARAAQRFASVPKLAGYGFQILTPATYYGTNAIPAGSKQILARHNDDEAHAGSGANGSADYIDLYSMNIDWTTPANSGITTLPRVAITEFNSWFRDYSTFATVPQPGSTSRLDPIREVILNQLVYRNMGTHEAIIGTFATNQNSARTGTTVDSGIRWFELRKSGTGNWALHQEGTYSPGDTSTHHLLGTVAMDKNGNIGMAYNVTKTTSPTVYASLRYTGRTPSDASGVMSLGENEVATGSAAETSGRWGDYYQMTVDPVDDCTFYLVGSYRPSGSWNTRIADFKFSNCGTTGTTYSISGTIANSSGVGIANVSVSNGSASTTTNSSGAYTLSNLANATYTITPTLSGYSFSPANRAVTVNGANVTGQNFTGTATTPTTYSISGTITNSSGAAISGVTVSTGAASATTNSSGAYSIANLANGSYTVTPSLAGYSFSPVNRAVTISGANQTAQNFTGTVITSNVLSKGVAVTGLGAATGASLNYTMVVPAGASNLTFTMSGGTGDADLYVKFGAAPTDTVYDCRPYKSGNAETCTFAAPSAGTYYVRIKAYSTFSGVSIVGDYSTGGGTRQTYSNTADYNIGDNTTVESPITVSGRSGNAWADTSVSVNIVHTYQGDLKVDLVAPDGTLYNIHNRTGSGTDNIIKTVTLNLSSEAINGTWKLRVNDNAAGDVGYINSWSITM